MLRVHEQGVGVSVSFDDPEDVAGDVAGVDSDAQHLTNLQSYLFSVAQGQQELLAVDEIKDRIKLLDNQLNAAHRALFQLGGGVLFAKGTTDTDGSLDELVNTLEE